jgi:hypothetical protein
MDRARQSMAEARHALQGLGSQANGIDIPAHPAAIRGRIREVLAETNRTAQSAQRELQRLEADLARRKLLLLIADTIGSLSPLKAAPKLGSGAHTPDGLIPAPPGVDDEAFGGFLGGIEKSLEKYSKSFHLDPHLITRVEREIQTSTRYLFRNGGVTIERITREVERFHVSVEMRQRAVKYAKAAGRAGRVLGIVGHIDNAVTLYNAFGVKGKAKASAIGGATGKALGGAGGAAVGASIGASVGTLIPVPILGTALGAGVGAAIGGFAGSELGKAAGAAIGEGVRRTGEAVGNAAKKATESAKKAADSAKNAFGSAKKTFGKLF